MQEKVVIEYACSQDFSKMENNGIDTKFYSTCKHNVHDFSQQSDFKTDGIKCGRFNLNQVSSFKRNFTLNRTAVPLLTLLGLTFSYNPVLGQDSNESNKESIEEEKTNNTLKIRGTIVDKENKLPITSGIMEVLNSDTIVAASLIGREGSFSFDIDTNQFKINELGIHFYNGIVHQSDTSHLVEQPDKTY